MILVSLFILANLVPQNVIAVTIATCEDADPGACEDMAIVNPNMCQETILSTKVCPKHCNKCPLVCYSGETSIDPTTNLIDFRQSNTVSCNAGQICKLSPHGTVLGSYMAECGDQQQCTNADICCNSNLCNTPKALTTLPPPTTTPKPTTTTVKQVLGCASRWFQFQNSCYWFETNTRLSWTDANAQCFLQSSHLAIIETPDEQEYLKRELQPRIDTSSSHSTDTLVWIAGTDSHVEGFWEWYNVVSKNVLPVTFTQWNHGQPNDANHNEDCMCMVGNKDFNWKDRNCNIALFYVCERSVGTIHGVPVPFASSIVNQHVTTSNTKPTSTHTTLTSTYATTICSFGWVLNGVSCYFFHLTSRKNWDEAKAYCEAVHSHLAIINSSDENNFLTSYLSLRINVHASDKSATCVWLAGTDRHNEGHWKWENGTDLKDIHYTNWKHGQPEGDVGHREQDCMYMAGYNDFLWHDHNCKDEFYFVCERNHR